MAKRLTLAPIPVMRMKNIEMAPGQICPENGTYADDYNWWRTIIWLTVISYLLKSRIEGYNRHATPGVDVQVLEQ